MVRSFSQTAAADTEVRMVYYALTSVHLFWCRVQLWGLAIGFLQLANPATEAFTNTLQLWLVRNWSSAMLDLAVILWFLLLKVLQATN